MQNKSYSEIVSMFNANHKDAGSYANSYNNAKRDLAENLMIFLFELYVSGRRPNGDTISDLISDLQDTLSIEALDLLTEMRIAVDESGVPEHVYSFWLNKNQPQENRVISDDINLPK